MWLQRTGIASCVLLWGLSVSGVARGQMPIQPPSTTPAPVPPPAAEAVAPEAPAPEVPAVAQPAPAAPPSKAAAPKPFVVPPGYRLVRIDEAGAHTGPDQPEPRPDPPTKRELPYEEGDPIPPGYELRDRPYRGLVIAGSIVTGVPWAFSVMAAVANDYDDQTGFLLLPALGPWLMLATGGAKDEHCSADDDYCSGSRAALRSVLVLDGLIQTAGAVMFVGGLTLQRKRLIRTDLGVGFVPTLVGRDGYGVGAFGTF